MKNKISKIKLSNIKRTKLKKQGKWKQKRNKKTVVTSKRQSDKPVPEDEEEVSNHGDDVWDMVDPEDLEYLKQAISEGRYLPDPDKKLKKRKFKEEDSIENKYEEENFDGKTKRTRHLLPIKAGGEIVRRAITEEVKEEKENFELPKYKEEEIEVEDENYLEDMKKPEKDMKRPISMAEMLALREDAIARYKFRIGILSSGLLENPQQNVMNITRLLDIYDDWHPEIQVTLKKLVILSLLEIFKDILPSYQIKHQDSENVKLKKETREIQTYEKRLLKGYRLYLTKLEKLASKLYRKKGDQRKITNIDISMGELAMKCLCDLLKTHYYFNYSKNIISLLTPYLDNKYPSVREQVSSAFTFIFVNDKRGEVTFDIVRRINELVKKKKHAVRCEVISILLALHLEDINLDDNKEADLKQKKALAKKSRIINLSKKERKRRKKLEEVEKELLETKAEENKKARHDTLTEVTKMVFTIYFRILKNAPSSQLLTVALQGLAKFAHCINIDFYQDLVMVLTKLMESGDLKVKQELNCEHTVFRILSGHGEAFNIDPIKFYTHLYNSMLKVNAGVTSENGELLAKCLDEVILGRRKKLTQQRLLAFIKRLGIMSLHQEHHTTLAFLTIVKQILQVNKSTDILLEADSGLGQGVYLPDLPEPEHCNPTSTALYELTLLKRHYHPVVSKLAQHIAHGFPISGSKILLPEISKLTSSEIFNEYNPGGVAFKPSVPPPNKSISSTVRFSRIKDNALENLCNRILSTEFKADFSILYDEKLKVKNEKM